MAADLQHTLLLALSMGEASTTDQLAAHTGIPAETVITVMLEAAGQGLVLRLGEDRWELTGVGWYTVRGMYLPPS